MKINEVIYYCLDAIKAISDDSHVNEDHVLFLLSKYRAALLQQYHNVKKPITETNYQTVKLTLTEVEKLPGMVGPNLKSQEVLPTVLSITKPLVLLFNGFESEVIEYVPYSRLKSTGHNKWKKNFVYSSIGPNGYLYLSFVNPQAQYLETIQFKAVFEDFEKVYDLQYKDQDYDIMEQEFPFEHAMIPDLIARVVKDILGTAWRPADQKNDATDDLADIATFVRQNMKKRYNNIAEGEEE